MLPNKQNRLNYTCVSAVVATTVNCVIIALGFVASSRNLHQGALYPLLRAPMSFFDTNPVGRILNYMSNDMETADMALPLDVQVFLISLTSLLSTVITMAFSSWIFLIIILPIFAIILVVQVRHSSTFGINLFHLLTSALLFMP